MEISTYLQWWIILVDGQKRFAVRQADAKTAARLFMDQWFSRFGAPKVLISDEGKHFLNDTVDALNDIWDVDHHVTTAYRPQSNGKCERFNATLEMMLRPYADNHKRTWDETLSLVLTAYRSSISPVTNQTPFMLMFGRQMRLPLDHHLSELVKREDVCVQEGIPIGDLQIHQYIRKYQKAMDEVHGRLERVRREQCRVRVAKVHVGEEFLPGNKVWVYVNQIPGINSKINEGDPKFAPRWSGPFIVLYRVKDNHYQLEDDYGKKFTQLVHVARLKRFVVEGKHWNGLDKVKVPDQIPNELEEDDTFNPAWESYKLLETPREKYLRVKAKKIKKEKERIAKGLPAKRKEPKGKKLLEVFKDNNKPSLTEQRASDNESDGDFEPPDAEASEGVRDSHIWVDGDDTMTETIKGIKKPNADECATKASEGLRLLDEDESLKGTSQYDLETKKLQRKKIKKKHKVVALEFLDQGDKILDQNTSARTIVKPQAKQLTMMDSNNSDSEGASQDGKASTELKPNEAGLVAQSPVLQGIDPNATTEYNVAAVSTKGTVPTRQGARVRNPPELFKSWRYRGANQ